MLRLPFVAADLTSWRHGVAEFHYSLLLLSSPFTRSNDEIPFAN